MNKAEVIKKLEAQADRWWDVHIECKDSVLEVMRSTRALAHCRGYQGAIAIVKMELMEESE